MGTILIIDEDLGFLMYLGLILAEAGYQPWPARNVREAIGLIRKLGAQVELVIAPFAELNSLIPTLTVCAVRPKLVATEDSQRPESAAIPTSVDDVILKPTSREEFQRRKWLDMVRKALQPVAITYHA